MNPEIKEIKSIAVIAHPNVDEAAVQAQKIVDYLNTKDINTATGLLNEDEIRERVISKEFDLVITLGGDGTVLRAGHLCAPVDVPIMAINHGRFGFLIEVASNDWESYMEKLFSGDFWLEKRMMLQTKIVRDQECLGEWEVLNEMVIGRSRTVRPVHLSTHLDGFPLTTYVADGLIVSTPTGSTAYALAAGGPVLPPELRNILLIPVAPHLSMDRAIVLAEGSKVSIQLQSDHEAVLSVDGQEPIDLENGDRVEVIVSQHTVKFLRFQGAGYFYRNIIALMDQNPSAGVINK